MNSSTGGYYDVRAILAEDTDVPVTFATGVVEIGKILDPSGGEKDLAKGTKTKLPLWLVGPMAQRHMIQVRYAHIHMVHIHMIHVRCAHIQMIHMHISTLYIFT